MARTRRQQLRGRPPVVEPSVSFNTMATIVLGFVAFVMFAVAASIFHKTKPTTTTTNLYSNPHDIPTSVASNLDAIFILGGGAPLALDAPPDYVQKRCDDAASIRRLYKNIPILCLSAGTAHVPQFLSNGLPVWESTACAAYLDSKHSIQNNVFVETTSYDTIGNAFFARTSHTDLNGWRKILIITNNFHMARTQAIFNWIFDAKYQLYFLQTPDTGLTPTALDARRAKEAASLTTVQDYARRYPSLKDVYQFLTTRHGLYTAQQLVARGRGDTVAVSADLKASYGGQSNL